MRRVRAARIAAFATALAATIAFPLGCGESKKNEAAQTGPPVVFVQQPRVQEMTLYDEHPGRIAASARVEIRARVEGVLEEALFEDGQDVERGDVLFRIEREPLRAVVNASEAAVAIAEAQVELAEAELSRASAALARDAATELEVRRARAEAERRRGELKAARAQLEQAQIDLSYAEITSPISGRISETYVDVGNLVGREGPTLLTVIVAYDPIEAYFDVNEREVLDYLERVPLAERARTLDNVRLQLADGNTYPQKGTVNFANVELDEGAGTLELRAVFPNEGRALIPGLFARVGLPLPTETVTLIPVAATLRDISGDYVMVVNSDGQVERRGVTLGRMVEDSVVIEEGLGGDERVVVRGLQRARPGSQVQAKETGGGSGGGATSAGAAGGAASDQSDPEGDESPPVDADGEG